MTRSAGRSPRPPQPSTLARLGGLALVSGLIAFPAVSTALEAPGFERELDTIPILDALGPVERTWYGGWENPRPQLLDADGDLDLDLFVAEADGRLRFYRNDGNPASPDFVFQTDDYAGVHELYFTRFLDVDVDGDHDLLVEAPPFVVDIGGTQVERTGAFLYTNTGSPAAPVWTNLSAHPDGYFADDAGEPIPFVTTTPDFVDLEGDGDPDLLFGNPSGSVELYRNVGTTANPSFRFETSQYNDILIVFGSCGAGRVPPRPQLRHGFMLFSFFDYDDDTLPDMFVGDQFNANVYHYRNLGGAQNPNFQCITEGFFPGSPGDYAQFLVSAFGDLDDDGDPDALLGSGSSSTSGIFFFRNDPPLRRVTDDYLPEFDLGRDSAPALADLDADGDLDLLLGVANLQAVALYENVGDASDPVFALIDETWLPLPNSAWAAPELADIDGDGDDDLLVGMTSGGVRWFRNDSPDSATFPPVYQEVTDDPDFGDVFDRTFRQNVDSQAVPRFLDADADGDLDALLGNWDFSGEASLLLFRNDGSSTTHDFVPVSIDYQGLGVLGQQITPFLADLDGDGDRDLVVGNRAGKLSAFSNVGGSGPARFVPGLTDFAGVDVGAGAVPWLADVDGDDDPDLVVGESGGGLNFYRACQPGTFDVLEPAPEAVVDPASPIRFDWSPSMEPGGASEAGYELRIAASPDSPEIEWTRYPGLSESEITLALSGADRLRRSFHWSVAALGNCGSRASAWRRVVNGSFPVPESSPFEELRIRSVHPSPSGGPSSIAIEAPLAGVLRVSVHDLAGRTVARVASRVVEAGAHELHWDGRNLGGGPVAAGVYFVRAELGRERATQRVVVIR